MVFVVAMRIFNTSTTQAVVKEVSENLKTRQPKHIVLINPGDDYFLQSTQGKTYRIQTERGHNKFEVMLSSFPQSYVINKHFSDIGAIISPYETYEEASFLGFLIMAPEKLLNKENNVKLFAALEQDFREMKRLLPRSVVGLMQRVALYLNVESEPCVRGLCFHRDRSWLGKTREVQSHFSILSKQN